MADPEVKVEEEKKKLVDDDIRVIIEGTSKRIFIKDKDGTEHRLNPITVLDLIDFEDKIGISVLKILDANLSIKHIVYLVYLSLRREGCTKEDIERGKFKYTERQIQEMFDLRLLRYAVKTFVDLLSISGFGLNQGSAANPPEPAGQKDTTPDAEKKSQ
jgi:hypothetical protein